MKHNPLFSLYCLCIRPPARFPRLSSLIIFPLRIFFSIYFHIKGIRDGVNDEGIRFYIRQKFGISIGKHTYGYFQLCQKYSKLKSIGSFCSIGAEVKIIGISHPHNHVTTSPVLYSSKFGLIKDNVDLLDFYNPAWDIHIGNDVYIGQYAKILPGVRIGDGAVLGAGSIVTKDIPAYSIVAGVPAKIIKYRFSPKTISALEEIRWWEWDDEKISKNISIMQDVDDFINLFRDESV